MTGPLFNECQVTFTWRAGLLLTENLLANCGSRGCKFLNLWVSVNQKNAIWAKIQFPTLLLQLLNIYVFTDL